MEILDDAITVGEVKAVRRGTGRYSALGRDWISRNLYVYLGALTTIFNRIMIGEDFGEGYRCALKPHIHIRGNYRGISLIETFSKICAEVLNKGYSLFG